MKKVFAFIAFGLAGIAVIAVIIISALGHRFYKTNLRGFSDNRARDHLRILLDAARRGDDRALVTEYDNNRSLWQDLESKNQMVAETDATVLSQAYEHIGRNKDAALQYYKLARLAQQKGSKRETTYYIGKAAGLNPQNSDVESLRAATGTPIEKNYKAPADGSGSGIIKVFLSSKGIMALDAVVCNSDTLISMLRQKLRSNPTAQVMIYPDIGVPYKSLEEVMDKAKQAGAKYIRIHSVP